MIFNDRCLYRRTFGVLSLLCILSFTFFYFNNYLLFDKSLTHLAPYYDTLEYVRLAITKIIDFIIPTVSALLLFPKILTAPPYRVYPAALLLALSHAFRNLPYYYLYNLAFGYDSIESISITVPLALFLSALYALYSVALAYVAKLLFYKRGAKDSDATLPCQLFSISSPVSFAVFSIAFIHFLALLISEAVDTVIFFIEYADSYRIGEIIYIFGSFIYILVTMLIGAALCTLVYNKIIRGRMTNTDDITSDTNGITKE